MFRRYLLLLYQLIRLHISDYAINVKGKAIPLQAWTGPEGLEG